MLHSAFVVVVVVVVVVECYCFLINIIDENIETLPLLPRSISVQKTNGFARWRREVVESLQKP